MANHAVVQAKLIIKGKDYGAHPFLVPLRSLKDHTPLPGVVIKDQGPKQGAISMDNGYARFNHVRIPRTNVSFLFGKHTYLVASFDHNQADMSVLLEIDADEVLAGV